MSSYTAFAGERRLVTGTLAEVTHSLREAQASGPAESILALDDATGRTLEVDLRVQATGPALAEEAAPAAPRPGRPRLGVVAREITLLPRHWEWLARQPGGASVALRKLVEAASRASRALDKARESQEAFLRAMTTLAGDRTGFEEACRALYGNDFAGVRTLLAAWPEDISTYLDELLHAAQEDAYEARED